MALLAQPAWRSHADAVTDWNVVALNATAVPPNAILQSRVLAIVHGAVYDAVRAVDRKGSPYAVDLKAPAGTSVDAAVAAAAHGALVRLAPAQRAMLDAALDAALAKIADGHGKTEGIRIGAQIAEKIVALRSADKSDVRSSSRRSPAPVSTSSRRLIRWPRFSRTGAASRPSSCAAGAALSSRARPPSRAPSSRATSMRSRASVRATAATRTADQTAAAIFWTVQTGVPWFAAARAASAAKSLSVSENARLFAALSMATADSQIVGFEEKYKRPHWRPITAIRAAADLDIPTLKGDPSWEPLLVTPPQPDYPSAHAIFSGAAEAVLRVFFGSDDVNVSVTFPAPFGVTRTHRKFSEMAEEVDNARVWGGIHFRSADKDGSDIGRKIGTIVMRDFPKPTTN